MVGRGGQGADRTSKRERCWGGAAGSGQDLQTGEVLGRGGQGADRTSKRERCWGEAGRERTGPPNRGEVVGQTGF